MSTSTASRGASSVLRLFALALVGTLLSLLSLAPSAHAAALTTVLKPHERSCFYAWADQAGEKVGFYFAVQSGGSFDIDYEIHSPSDKVIMSAKKERQLDVIFTANEVGEYSFCFENDMSNWADKMLDFDITVESEPRLELPLAQQALLSEKSAPLEESVAKLGSQLTSLHRTNRYFALWENRGLSLVKQTQNKIFLYTLFESSAVIAISVAQVYMVKFLLEKGGAKRYRV